MSLIHPVLPKGGREATILFSKSRENIVVRHNECVVCQNQLSMLAGEAEKAAEAAALWAESQEGIDEALRKSKG